MDVLYLRCMSVAYAACIDSILPLFRVEGRDQGYFGRFAT